MNWLYNLFDLDPVARSINQERIFTNTIGACLTIAFFVIVFVAWFIKELLDAAADRKEEREWLKHCEGCKYFHRIHPETTSYYDRRGVVCYNGVGYNHVQNPLGCTRFKPKETK